MLHLRSYAKGHILAGYRGFINLEPDAEFDVSVIVHDAGSAVEKYNERTIDGSARCDVEQFSEDGMVLRYEERHGQDEWRYAMTLLLPWHALMAVEVVPVE